MDAAEAAATSQPGRFRRDVSYEGGIHFAPLPTTGWGVAPQLSVGHGLHVDGLFKEAIEQQPPGSGVSSVEPKRELVEVVLEVSFADAAVVSSQPPTLQQRGDSMDPRHGHVSRDPGASLARGTMGIAVPRQGTINVRG